MSKSTLDYWESKTVQIWKVHDSIFMLCFIKQRLYRHKGLGETTVQIHSKTDSQRNHFMLARKMTAG